jgi:hypothetical protein
VGSYEKKFFKQFKLLKYNLFYCIHDFCHILIKKQEIARALLRALFIKSKTYRQLQPVQQLGITAAFYITTVNASMATESGRKEA